MKMKNKQREITVEQVLYSLIGVMIRHSNDINFDTSTLCEICKYGNDIVIDATTLGLRYEYLTIEKGNYSVTDQGNNAYEKATTQPSIISDAEAQFRDEVLTGITPYGKQTDIDRAALPRLGFVRDENKVQYNAAIRVDEQMVFEQFLAATGETLDTVREGLESGRIGVCKADGIPHWGKFDKAGDGYRPVCKRCRKVR